MDISIPTHGLRWFAALGAAMGFACGEDPATAPSSSSDIELRAWLNVPDHFQLPAIPEFNRPTPEKIELGRHLFYDVRLSGNQTQACASCHEPARAFADGKKAPVGSTGHGLVRNSQGLGNIAYHASLTWANNGLLELEDQLQIPIRADNPVELGVNDGNREEVLARFDNDSDYAERFAAAFPDSPTGATINKMVFALASFMRAMISGDSPYDRFINGQDDAMTEQARRGMALFHSETFECFHCHSGINFSVSYRDANTTDGTIRYPFFNNGLYNVDGDGSYPAHDQGLYDVTLNPRDRGLFRPPSLRNVALTAPYMHDGSIATLREAVGHYAAGGTVTSSGAFAGDGRVSPLKSGLVRGFRATDDEIDAVVAFLEALTDPTFVNHPALSDPFAE